MKYNLYLSLYSEALTYDDVDMYIGERGWQDWMDQYDVDQVATMLKKIYWLANNDPKEIREHYGFSRAAFSRAYGIPLRTLENWELGNREAPKYVIALLTYTLFVGDYYGNRN